MFFFLEFLIIPVAIVFWLISFLNINSISTLRHILSDLYTRKRSHWMLDLFQVIILPGINCGIGNG